MVRFMEYNLLSDNNAVITSREPEVISGNLGFLFKGAPDGATAIFERDDGDTIYRALAENKCEVKCSWFKGITKVTVVVLNGSMTSQRWFCESFMASKQDDGVLVYPYDMDMQGKVARLQEDVAALKSANKMLSDKYTELDNKLTKLLEGYDIV